MANRILRLPEVKSRVGISRSSIYSRIKKKQFPAPISLGEHSVGWLSDEIDVWIEQRIEDSRKEGAA